MKRLDLSPVFMILVLWAMPAELQAQYSPAVGSSTAGTDFQNLRCTGDRVLIGVEVKHGNTGAGTVRGTCREVGWDGVWSGSSTATGWSWNNASSERSRQTNRNCSSGRVAVGFAGATSGPNVHRLQLVCGRIEGDATTTDGSPSGWAGHPGGDPSSNLFCPPGEVAHGIQVRARSILHYMRLICGDLPVVEEPTSIVNVNGYEAYDYARRRGFRFRAVNDATGGEDTNCSLGVDSNRLLMEISPSSGTMTCRFELFHDGRMRNDWVIRSIRLDHEDNSCRRTTRVDGPASAAEPDFDVHVERRRSLSHMPPLCIVRLRSVRLEGPASSDWRRAFRR